MNFENFSKKISHFDPQQQVILHHLAVLVEEKLIDAKCEFGEKSISFINPDGSLFAYFEQEKRK